MTKMVVRFAVVEDDELVCAALGNLLESHGQLTCVGLFTEAHLAEEQLPGLSPDVVLVDLQLGEASGIELLKTLKPLMPQCQFMVITVFAESDKVFESLKAGATGYILKDSEPSDYFKAMEVLLSGGSPLSPAVARMLIESLQPKAAPALNHLTPREREVLDLLADGYAYKQVADVLCISLDTVRSHIRHLYEKLHVQSRAQAVNVLQGKSKR